MRKLRFVVLAAAMLVWAGCNNLGEDPLPSPGPNADGSVTLFVNGSLYNFDYTAQYDGIQLVEYIAASQDGRGGAFSNLGSSAVGGFSGSQGSIYSVKGDKALEFSHDLRYNTPEGETWRITLFDDPPMLLSDYTHIAFWAKYAGDPEPYENDLGTFIWPEGEASITIRAETKKGYSVVNTVTSTGVTAGGKNTFTTDEDKDGQWRRFTVTLDKNYYVPNPESPLDRSRDIRIPIPPDDTIKSWSIHVPVNAGRIYVDEIILKK
jgi:hypothetical protein